MWGFFTQWFAQYGLLGFGWIAAAFLAIALWKHIQFKREDDLKVHGTLIVVAEAMSASAALVQQQQRTLSATNTLLTEVRYVLANRPSNAG